MSDCLFEKQTLLDPNTLECPYDYYRAMQNNEPVHYDAGADTYLVTRYDLIVQAAKDFETFSSDMDLRREGIGPSNVKSDALFKRDGYLVEDVLTQVDPPRHTQFRSMVSRLFVGPVANKMEAYIEAHVDTLIDGFIDDGEVEFFRQFAVPLPLDLIADQLGVPREDKAQFKVWTDAIIETLGVMLTEERKLQCTALIIDFQHYFVQKMVEKRAQPENDIISTIATARLDDEDRDLTTEERLALIQQILVAGNETTRNHLAKSMVLLCQNSETQVQLREEPSLIKNFIEETLRLESPVQGLFRKTTKDVEFGGTFMPAGSKVLLMYGAANRDPKQFEDPEELDVFRKNSRLHLAFGAGPHACIGAMLARKEIEVTLRQILKRLQSIELKDSHSPIRHRPNLILRGMDGELTLTFQPTQNSDGE
ncbi:MAG: cytochrome P450 [Sphingorhabdus sp.]